jgi:hypothetical protein
VGRGVNGNHIGSGISMSLDWRVYDVSHIVYVLLVSFTDWCILRLADTGMFIFVSPLIVSISIDIDRYEVSDHLSCPFLH